MEDLISNNVYYFNSHDNRLFRTTYHGTDKELVLNTALKHKNGCDIYSSPSLGDISFRDKEYFVTLTRYSLD